MAERIVDGLEQIKIEHEQRELIALTPHLRQRLLHFAQQHRAIGEARQVVMTGHVRDLRFGAFLRGNVLMDGDPPTIRHRPVIDGKHTAAAHGGLDIIGLALADFRQTGFDVTIGLHRTVGARCARFENRTQ